MYAGGKCVALENGKFPWEGVKEGTHKRKGEQLGAKKRKRNVVGPCPRPLGPGSTCLAGKRNDTYDVALPSGVEACSPKIAQRPQARRRRAVAVGRATAAGRDSYDVAPPRGRAVS